MARAGKRAGGGAAVEAARGEGPARRGRGRPGRISREAVIDAAMRILESTPIEDFMLKSVATALGTGSMAIYNYFPGREALLDAVNEHVCALFEPPRPRATWQQTLLAWLRALAAHAERYPVMPGVIGLKGQTAPGWIRMSAPVTVLFHDELGLRGKRLALATYLFGGTVSMMIHVVSAPHEMWRSQSFRELDHLIDDPHQLAVLQRTPLAALTRTEILEAMFAQLIRGLESMRG